MAVLPPSVDYTDKDFDSLRARLRVLVKSVFPEWEDDATADFGNLLLELYAFVGDVLTYYQDNQAREAFFATATQRSNLLALARQLGYRVRGATVATVDVTFTLAAAAVARVSLPARTRVLTDEVVDPVTYETLEEVAWEVGQSGARTVSAENAARREELLTATGTPDQVVQLAGSPFVDGSLALSAGNGAYEVVETLLDSSPADRHCVVEVGEDDRASVRFGDGVLGAPPSGTLAVSYTVGGGVAGRVEAGKLRRLESPVTDEAGNPVAVTVSNTSASSLAEDRQSNEDVRERAPLSLRTLTRTVAREDFELNALDVPGVARALMLTSDETAAVPENEGFLYVVATGGAAPSQAVLDAVLEKVTVEKPCTVTFAVNVLSALFLTVDVRAELALVPGAVPATVRDGVVVALQELFSVEGELDFGYRMRDADGDSSIAWSDVFNAVRDVPGVRRVSPGGVLLNGAAADISVEYQQYPSLGEVTVVDVATGAVL